MFDIYKFIDNTIESTLQSVPPIIGLLLKLYHLGDFISCFEYCTYI